MQNHYGVHLKRIRHCMSIIILKNKIIYFLISLSIDGTEAIGYPSGGEKMNIDPCLHIKIFIQNELYHKCKTVNSQKKI